MAPVMPNEMRWDWGPCCQLLALPGFSSPMTRCSLALRLGGSVTAVPLVPRLMVRKPLLTEPAGPLRTEAFRSSPGGGHVCWESPLPLLSSGSPHSSGQAPAGYSSGGGADHRGGRGCLLSLPERKAVSQPLHSSPPPPQPASPVPTPTPTLELPPSVMGLNHNRH